MWILYVIGGYLLLLLISSPPKCDRCNSEDFESREVYTNFEEKTRYFCRKCGKERT